MSDLKTETPSAHIALANALDPPRVGQGLRVAGVIKSENKHFQVRELALVSPEGSGSHLWLDVQREGMNTEFAVRQIARITGVAKRDVGYAGLKDRHALTRQWFSVPGEHTVDALRDSLQQAGLDLVDCAQHSRKLRRGALTGNHFKIFVQSDSDVNDMDWGIQDTAVREALAWVQQNGAPNYFGPQRFGFDGNNLQHAVQMLCHGRRVRERHRRSLYLSAARSALFNQVLAARVRDGSWAQLLEGEAAVLNGSASYFVCESHDQELPTRLQAFDIHPSGPLYGDNDTPALHEAARVESNALRGCEELMAGLRGQRMDSARRALRVALQDLQCESVSGQGWWLDFSLPAGVFATSVLREIFTLTDASVRAAP